MRERLVAIALIAVFVAPVVAAPAQPVPKASPIFRFQADRFWLNLHHFLYVLGRAEARLRDASRRAVAGAPADQERGLGTLSAGERAAWVEAVRMYAEGPSRKDIVFDDGMVAMTTRLATLDADTVPAEPLLAPVAAALTRAAPAYRKAWWNAHRTANAKWVGTVTPLVEKHGPAVLGFLNRVYEVPWPKDGYPIHIAAYANWAGAYSVTGGPIVIASTDEGNAGLRAMESAFHETMHQWDDVMERRLVAHARAVSVSVPDWLSHALLFYTAGAAVRSVLPDYVGYADADGIWQRSGKPFKAALDELWAPYLAGKTTRDEALAEILRKTGTAKE
jgi:hypothetical protein